MSAFFPLWVVLIVLFVGFYRGFGTRPAGDEVVPPADSAPRSLWGSIFVGWLPVVFLVLFFIIFFLRLRNRHAPTHEGMRLLNQGRYVQALEIFDKCRKDQPTLAEIPAGKGDPGRLALVEAILLVRAGDTGAARAKLSTFEVKQMSGTIGALARTLDALCIERLTGELRHVDRIALFGETGPDELRKAWPELIAFVERAPAW